MVAATAVVGVLGALDDGVVLAEAVVAAAAVRAS